MARRNGIEGSYEQMPQVEGAVEPYVYGRQFTLKDLFYVLRKRKWIIIASLVSFAAVAAIASLKATPMYRSTAQVEIEKESLNLLSFQEVVNVDTTNIDYYNTQYTILKSRTLAQTVAEKLKEASNPQDAKLTRKDVQQATKVQPVRSSRLVDIVAHSPFPEQAARIANTLAEAYIEQDLNKKVQAIRGAADKLRDELTKAKAKVDQSEQEFTQFKDKNNIVSLNEKQNLVLEELSKLTEAAALARKDRIAKEERHNYLKTLSLEQLRHEQEVVNNEQIRAYKTEEFKADLNLKKLAQTYGEKHPLMIKATEELANVTKKIDQYILRVSEEVKNDYLKAKKEEERLVAEVEKKNQEVLDFYRRVKQYEILQREVDTNKKYYQEMLNRSQETDISERTEKSNIRIVDRADVPEKPFKPRTKLNLILAIAAGLMVGCGGAFFVEHLNDTVEDPADIELFLARPFLGAVPVISDRYEAIQDRGKISHLLPQSTVSEAYKTLLAGIQYSPASNSLRTILVTSAGPAEGKTTTVTNLGISAAQNGKRVLLVDCDLRKPAIHNIFGLKKDVGLSDYLIGEADLEQVIQETGVPNLSAIARGGSSPNPSGLVSSDRMKEFAELVRQKFDLVFFDSPPCTVVADPLILANLVDAVINVTQSGRFSRRLVGRGLSLLDKVNANVIGIVLNEVKERDHRYYYYYGYGYRGYSYYTKEGAQPRKPDKS